MTIDMGYGYPAIDHFPRKTGIEVLDLNGPRPRPCGRVLSFPLEFLIPLLTPSGRPPIGIVLNGPQQLVRDTIVPLSHYAHYVQG